MIDEKELIEYLETRAEESKREWERFDDHGAFGEYHAFSSVIDYVNSMPKSREWIPVSERLPEERKDCLVTVEYDGFMGKHGVWIRTGHIEPGGDWWGDCMGGDVVAWQPLPEPYRGDTDDSTV